MEELQLRHEVEHDVLAFDAQRQLHLLASLTAPEARTDDTGDQRSPVDLVAVLDRSGSMAGAKLQSVKDTAKFLVQQLFPQDKLSVVTFETDVIVNFALREMTAEGKAAAQLAIDRIQAGGGTNLSGGLFKGIDQHQQGANSGVQPPTQHADSGAEASASANASPPANASPRPAARPDRIRTVFLFTDGQATTGVTNSARLKGILNLMLENSIRPTIHCFGFGHHYDAECLEAVAEAGQGQSAFIEDAESTPAALATALGGIMSIVAQNVEVTFTPKAGVAIRDIDTAFRVTNNNGIFTVTLGDIFAEEKKDLLVKLQVNALEAPQSSQEVVYVQLRYLNLALGAMKQSEVAASIARPAEAAADLPMQPQVEEAMLRLGTAKAMKDAVSLGDRGDLPGARDLLQRQLDKLPPDSAAPVITALRADLQQLLAGYQTRQTYMTSRHHGLSMSSSHRTQRHTSHTTSGPATNPSLYASRTQQRYSRRATESVPLSSASQPAAPPAQQRTIPYSAPLGTVQSGPQASGLPVSPSPQAGSEDSSRQAGQPRARHSPLAVRRRTSDQASMQRTISNVSAAGTEVYDPVSEGTGYQHYDDWLDTVHSNQSGEHSSVTFPPVPHTAAATPDLVTGMLSTTTLSGTGRENSSNEA